MKKPTQLVAFGDSFVYGDELVDPKFLDQRKIPTWQSLNTPYRETHSFPGLIANHFNLKHQNKGIPGGSLVSTRWEFIKWLQNDPNIDSTIVLIGLTDEARTSWWNRHHQTLNRPFVHTTWASWVEDHPPWNMMVRYHWDLSDCDEFREMQLLESTTLFDSVAQAQDIQLLMFPIFANKTIELDSYWDFCLNQEVPRDGKHRFGRRHPNEAGHQFLADKFISYIQKNLYL